MPFRHEFAFASFPPLDAAIMRGLALMLIMALYTLYLFSRAVYNYIFMHLDKTSLQTPAFKIASLNLNRSNLLHIRTALFDSIYYNCANMVKILLACDCVLQKAKPPLRSLQIFYTSPTSAYSYHCVMIFSYSFCFLPADLSLILSLLYFHLLRNAAIIRCN